MHTLVKRESCGFVIHDMIDPFDAAQERSPVITALRAGHIHSDVGRQIHDDVSQIQRRFKIFIILGVAQVRLSIPVGAGIFAPAEIQMILIPPGGLPVTVQVDGMSRNAYPDRFTVVHVFPDEGKTDIAQAVIVPNRFIRITGNKIIAVKARSNECSGIGAICVFARPPGCAGSSGTAVSGPVSGIIIHTAIKIQGRYKITVGKFTCAGQRRVENTQLSFSDAGRIGQMICLSRSAFVRSIGFQIKIIVGSHFEGQILALLQPVIQNLGIGCIGTSRESLFSAAGGFVRTEIVIIVSFQRGRRSIDINRSTLVP